MPNPDWREIFKKNPGLSPPGYEETVEWLKENSAIKKLELQKFKEQVKKKAKTRKKSK